MAGQSQEIPQEALPDVELADVVEDRDAAEELVRWIHDRYDNEESNAGFRRALRTFARRATDGSDIPESVEWVPTTLSNNYDPSPNPRDMLHWDADVLPMIDNTLNDRDAALIAVAWDSGARGDELHQLEVGDVTDHKHGLQLTVQGKTGQRTVTLIPSVPFLQEWLADHPDSGDRDAPLWSRLNSPESVSYETLWKAVTRAGERADIEKPVNFTNFRKSSASYLASQGMSQAHLEEHHGWVRGSEVAGRYVAVFGDEADNELARIHGKEIAAEDESPDHAPVPCPRCGEETPREKDFCIHCRQSLDLEVKQLLDRVKETLDDELVEADDAGDREDLVRARRTLDEKPGVMDRSELHELASSLED
ncbi:tyrosine-type recombinase/integrase [Halorussus halobius]|uniref:tyrosine-type recombinase/integrase n=1 Tax=Halorussus halobius TaxID=1710537 RepID=UPI0037424559